MDLTPFKQDIDELLDEFTKGNFTTLADMKKVWMAKKFSYIYEAKPTSNSALFMQSLYAHCIGHMISTGVLSRRLGGLYCLYCLYEIQPYKPHFKIYLSLGELKRLKDLVVDAKENDIGIVPALVKRMLDGNMFLFGIVDIVGGSVAQRADEITKLQNRRAQIACEKLLANTHIEDYLQMDLVSAMLPYWLTSYLDGLLLVMFQNNSAHEGLDYVQASTSVVQDSVILEQNLSFNKSFLGVELELEAFKKMSKEYMKAKEFAIKEASHTVEIEDIKHIAENKKMVGNMVEKIVKEWDAQKEIFSGQTGISHQSDMVTVNGFEELEHLLNE